MEGGDLGAYPNKEAVDAFRATYIKQFLDPLAYNTKGSGAGVRTFNIQRKLDELFQEYDGDIAQLLGCAFVREPFCFDFMDLVGLEDDAAFFVACKAFLAVSHKVFRWGDYLEARTTAEQAFREFYGQQHYAAETLGEALDGFIISFFNQVIDERQYEWEDAHPGEEMPEPAEDDIDNLYLARLFSVLPYKAEDDEFCKSIGVTYHYDQLHMCCWFAVQVTNGGSQYSRDKVNYSARTTYNRLLNPYSLLWIGVVMGADRNELKAAATEMSDKKANAAKCGIVRKHVPFDTILELYHKMMDAEEE